MADESVGISKFNLTLQNLCGDQKYPYLNDNIRPTSCI
jgi:hypothetical protein